MVTVIAIIVAVVVVAIVVALVLRARRHAQLHDMYGDEYDRTVRDAGSKRAAAKELRERKARHDELEITPLDPAVAQRYRDQWRLVQESFVDTPAESVAGAHRLVRDVLAARRYPTDDDHERVAMLSVDHADVLDRYRQGMRTEQAWRDAGQTNTEELRQAMQHYRTVFDRVVGETADDAYPQDGSDSSREADVSGQADISGKDRVRRTPVE